MSKFTKQPDPVYLTNTDAVPAKELMKAARKRDYEKAKARRKQEKVATKAAKASEREQMRAERDKALWSAMKRATDLEGDE